MVSDPPKFGEIRAGWYEVTPNDWFLTWNALKTEYCTSGKKLDEVTVTTNARGVNKGRLRTTIRVNKYNQRAFVVYSLDDFDMLWHEMRKKRTILLPEDT